MMLLRIVHAEYLDAYKIKLIFNTGFEAQVDLESKIFNDHRAIFKPLRELAFFRSFRLDRWTIRWPNQLDLAPEFLDQLAKQQAPLKTVKT